MTKRAKKAKRLAKEVAALTAEVAGLKTQMARLRTEQKAALKAEAGSLNKRLQAESEKAVLKPRLAAKEAKVVAQTIGEKAAKAKGETKSAIEARMKSARGQPPKPTRTVEQPEESKLAPDLDLNKQEVKGRQEQAEGKLRGAAGKKAGDWEEQVQGKAEEIKGTVREAVGRTARKIDEK
jgi:uncharacterized protein YjbJ (UPF0337 family)/regulator of replication initiation timing